MKEIAGAIIEVRLDSGEWHRWATIPRIEQYTAEEARALYDGADGQGFPDDSSEQTKGIYLGTPGHPCWYEAESLWGLGLIEGETRVVTTAAMGLRSFYPAVRVILFMEVT